MAAKTKCTATQVQRLLEYMSSHPAFASGECTDAVGNQANSQEWDSLSDSLNRHGPVKSVEQWQQTWRDMKKKAKNEALMLDATGKITELSEQAKTILSIVASPFEGNSGINNKLNRTDCHVAKNDLKPCRCCLAPGFHRDLDSPYTWLDKSEIYSSMLQECFNIVLSKLPTSGNGICEACVKALRAARSFKRTVLCTEQELTQAANYVKIEVQTAAVKTEPKEGGDSDDSDDYFLADAVRDREAQSPDVKVEIKPEPSKKRPVPRKTKIAAKKNIKASGKKDVGVKDIISKLSSGGNALTIKKKRKSEVPSVSVTDIKSRKIVYTARSLNETKANAIISSRSSDKVKHRENLITILQYSNVVPFKDKSLLGYICAYCDATFPDPQHLRAHTESDHAKERLNFKSSFDMTEFSVKFDISDLNCTLCDEFIDNLNVLKEHLVKVHNKVVHNDIKDHMVQFKLKAGDIYECAMCSVSYETFKMLKQHMNRHYSNYHCSKCDASFASKRSLSAHRAVHLEGSFKCDACDKVFASKAKKLYHERCKHMGARNIGNCPYCDEPFRSYYQRNQHLVKVHNSEAKYKCNVCSKSYILKSLLMYHIKKNHLMERNSQCSECGYRFFSNKALKAHMVKHTGEKSFACPVCHKAYARKYTLREHMRIHNNDRRFKCNVCAMMFVQKCSLKSHLLSNHGISMAASEITCVDDNDLNKNK